MIGLANSHNFSNIPAGLIVPWANSSVTPPTGWSIFSSPYTGVGGFSGCYIIGAGNSYSADSSGIGGSPVGKVQFNTTFDGSHEGSHQPTYVGSGGIHRCRWGGVSEGQHIHRIEVTPTIAPVQLQLIKATSNCEKFPALSVLLNTLHSNIPWLNNVYPGGHFLRAGNSVYGAGTTSSQIMLPSGTYGADWVSNGLHDHDYTGLSLEPPTGPDYNFVTTNDVNPSFDAYAGEHNHSFSSIVVTENLKKVYVTAWQSNSDFNGFQGMIGLWDSSVPIPSGWQLANGTNGTIDMRDCFIFISTTANKGIVTGNNTITIAPATGLNMLNNNIFSADNVHAHEHLEVWLCDILNSIEQSINHPGVAITHHHSLTQTVNTSFKPQWYGLYIIQKM